MKKIYFACSIRGGRDDAAIYQNMVDLIRGQAEVLSEIFADKKLTPQGSSGPTESIWRQDINWIRQADAVIAEVTTPSLGVGYEIAKAEDWGKPILALFRTETSRSLSAMIDGSPGTEVVRYKSLQEAEVAIKRFIETL